MKKASLIFGIILICACLFKEGNVSALTNVMQFEDTGKVLNPTSHECLWYSNVTGTQRTQTALTCNKSGLPTEGGVDPDTAFELRMIKTTDYIDVEEGLYYDIDLRVFSNILGVKPIIWTTRSNSEWFDVVSVQESYSGNIQYQNNSTNNQYTAIPYWAHTTSYSILLRAKKTGRTQPQFGTQEIGEVISGWTQGNAFTKSWNANIRFWTVKEYKATRITESIERINKDQEERGEEEQQQGDESGNDSKEQAENTGNTLFDLFKNFVQALSGANTTNCKIDGDTGHVDFGELDFCSIQPPSFVQVIGSLIAVLICVPLSIIMVKRLINLFRSFQ